MKRTWVIALLVLVTCFGCLSADTQSLRIGNEIEITYSDQIVLSDDIPQFENREDRAAYLDGKYILNYRILSEDSYMSAPAYELSTEMRKMILEGRSITNDSLIQRLKDNNSVVLGTSTEIPGSYELLAFDNETIGETYFTASTDGLLAPTGYSFQGNILVDQGILRLSLTFFDVSQNLPKKLETIFNSRNGEYYWVSEDSFQQLFSMIESSSKKLEDTGLLELNLFWSQILDSISWKTGE